MPMVCAPESAATRAARPEQETVAGQTASTCVFMASMRCGEGAAADERKGGSGGRRDEGEAQGRRRRKADGWWRRRREEKIENSPLGGWAMGQVEAQIGWKKNNHPILPGKESEKDRPPLASPDASASSAPAPRRPAALPRLPPLRPLAARLPADTPRRPSLGAPRPLPRLPPSGPSSPGGRRRTASGVLAARRPPGTPRPGSSPWPSSWAPWPRQLATRECAAAHLVASLPLLPWRQRSIGSLVRPKDDDQQDLLVVATAQLEGLRCSEEVGRAEQE
ncbi:hypothetical protein U9M48_026010 [Paspalum notatum var. saurae]|uniref:Uncharacterized protein n=1 Tax=Paspalum notatum var. saurae TaxID=547442 RepID=A0AAQ3TQ17_PASNO